ncbi:MAG: glycoside hydrolase family 26 protein [Acidimicrobiales bacterium]
MEAINRPRATLLTLAVTAAALVGVRGIGVDTTSTASAATQRSVGVGSRGDTTLSTSSATGVLAGSGPIGNTITTLLGPTTTTTSTSTSTSTTTSTTAPAPPAPQPSRTFAPSSGAWLGAFVNESGVTDDSRRQVDLEALEQRIGRTVDIAHRYRGWDEALITQLESDDRVEGRIPMLSWHGTNSLSITSGAEDAWIASQASAVAAHGAPVLLRYGWEMEGDRNDSWTISPQSYVAAWRYLRAKFAASGATNAVWVWCPMAISFNNPSNPALAYYPGADQVDWLCADGYNWAPLRGKWRSFETIFKGFNAWGAAQGKPLMIGETGVQEGEPDAKAHWFDDATVSIKSMPAIKAFVYFDSMPKEYNWLLNSSPSAAEGFRRLSADPWFHQPH